MVAAATATINRQPSASIVNLRILIHEDATLDLQEHCNYLAQNNQNSAYWIGKADLHYRSISPMLPFHPERLKSQDYLDRSKGCNL
jgi:hypothetical protein